MYRRRTKGSRKFTAAAVKMAQARARNQITGEAPDYPPEPNPDEPFIVVTAEHRFLGVIHRYELYPTNRSDVFRVVIDGMEQEERRGWSRVLEWVREAFPRVSRFYLTSQEDPFRKVGDERLQAEKSFG